jgi:hypothetical protein
MKQNLALITLFLSGVKYTEGIHQTTIQKESEGINKNETSATLAEIKSNFQELQE